MAPERTYRMLFLGSPGTGKGTYSMRLAEKFGLKHIATGNILRETVKKGGELSDRIKGFIDKGELVPDEMIVQTFISRSDEFRRWRRDRPREP